MAGITIRDIAIAFGYDVDKKSEAKANESVKALKNTATKALAAIGIGFSLSKVVSAVKSVESVQDAITGVKKDWSDLVKKLDETVGLTKAIANGIKKVSAAGIDVVRRLGPRVSGIVKNLGGMRNVLKIIAVVGGAIYAAMNLPKITSGLKGVVGLLKSVKLSTLAIVAVFILLALLVEDFIAFMQGKNSLIGSILQQAGIDCDALRDKVRATWENIKKVFQTVGGAIKNVVSAIFGAIRQFWEQNGESIKKSIADAVVGIVDKLNAFSEWLANNRDTIVKVAGKVLALVAAFLAVKSAITKVTALIKAGSKIVSGLGTAFKFLTNPVGIAAAAIVAIAAIVYDFFNFMSGKDSVIGALFEKLGIDADEVRKKVTEAWGKIKTFLLNAWAVIKSIATTVWNGLTSFWKKHGEQIKSGLVTAWNIIKTVLLAVWNVIKTVATTVFGGLQKFWSNHGEQIKTAFVNIWNGIKNVVTTVWNILKSVATTVFNALKAFWEKWGSTIMAYFSSVWNTIKAVFGAVLDVLADLFAIFSALFAGDWKGLWENVKKLASDIWNGIVSIISSAWDTICIVFGAAVDFFAGIFQGVWDAICAVFDNVVSFFGGVWDSIVDIFTSIGAAISDAISGAVKGAINAVLSGAAGIINGFIKAINFAIGIINKIPGVNIKKLTELEVPQLAEGGIATRATSAIIGEGSEPEAVLPLSKLGGLISRYVSGGTGNIAQTVVQALKGAVSTMSTLVKAARPSIATTSNATTNNSNVSKVINFKSEVNQQFNGDAAAQKNISKAADSAADDITGELSRALTYS